MASRPDHPLVPTIEQPSENCLSESRALTAHNLRDGVQIAAAPLVLTDAQPADAGAMRRVHYSSLWNNQTHPGTFATYRATRAVRPSPVQSF